MNVIIEYVKSQADPKLSKRERAISYLFLVLTPLCEFPQDLKIEDTLDERGLILNVLANDEDLPFLIGRGGKIANSLRDLLHIWGTRHVASVKLFINRRQDESNPRP